MNMTDEYEMNEFDREWQPGPVVEIDWYGGRFDSESEADCSCEECEEDISGLELE
jgi:hypothetical protein